MHHKESEKNDTLVVRVSRAEAHPYPESFTKSILGNSILKPNSRWHFSSPDQFSVNAPVANNFFPGGRSGNELAILGSDGGKKNQQKKTGCPTLGQILLCTVKKKRAVKY